MADTEYDATPVLDAAHHLLSQCDGAVEEDGVGFNKPDALRVRKILSMPKLGNIDVEDLYDRLAKYDRQLRAGGIRFSAIVEPPRFSEETFTNPHVEAYRTRSANHVDESCKAIVFDFGKYKTESLFTVASHEKGRAYLTWIVESDPPFRQPWRSYAKAALAGEAVEVEVSSPKEVDDPRDAALAVFREISGGKGDFISVKFPREMKDAFKEEVDGRKWNTDKFRWEIPTTQILAAMKFFETRGIGTKLDAACLSLSKKEKFRRGLLDEIRADVEAEFEIPGLILPLFGYQRAGVKFLVNTNGRGLIADEMGLGKSAQFLAFVLHELQRNPKYKALIVCPAAVKINWSREVTKFTGLSYCLWSTKGPEGDINATFHIANYEALVDGPKRFHVVDALNKIGIDGVCADEAHYLKTRKSQRTQALMGAAIMKELPKYPGVKSKHLVLLTGTPILNRPAEGFTLFNFVSPKRFPSWFNFANRFGAWPKGNLHDRPSTPTNLGELHERTKDIMLRRRQVDVQKDMPPLITTEQYIELTPTEMKEYKDLFRAVVGAWSESGKPSMAEIHPLQEWLNGKKLERVNELIDEYLENGHSVLLFSTRLDPLKETQKKYGKDAVSIDGSMSLAKRQLAIDAIQDGKASIGCLSIRAAGVGINLTKADRVIFLDLDWVPAMHQQAQKRAHRTGQMNTVIANYLIVKDTFEEQKYEAMQEKQAIADQIVDGKLLNRKVVRGMFSIFLQKLRKDMKQLPALEVERMIGAAEAEDEREAAVAIEEYEEIAMDTLVNTV